jgi:hypothetical protein
MLTTIGSPVVAELNEITFAREEPVRLAASWADVLGS